MQSTGVILQLQELRLFSCELMPYPEADEVLEEDAC